MPMSRVRAIITAECLLSGGGKHWRARHNFHQLCVSALTMWSRVGLAFNVSLFWPTATSDVVPTNQTTTNMSYGKGVSHLFIIQCNGTKERKEIWSLISNRFEANISETRYVIWSSLVASTSLNHLIYPKQPCLCRSFPSPNPWALPLPPSVPLGAPRRASFWWNNDDCWQKTFS